MNTTHIPGRTSAFCLLLSAIAALGVGAGSSLAGPLDPPAGAVVPTGKAISEVEPRIAITTTNTPGDADSLLKITSRGSYYLVGNITGVAGKHGIEITASGVTLDLNGFDVAGIAGMGAFDGVSVTAAGLHSIAVINGTVHNWGGDGVDLGTSAATNCRVEGVLAGFNVGGGIVVRDGSRVSGCSVYGNTGNGISAGVGATITGCTAYNNTGNGISSALGCTISHCSAAFNVGSGIYTSGGSTITGCSATYNITHGIYSGSDGTVADCTASFNTRDGIVCTSTSFIRGNTCSLNGSGAGDGAGIHATGVDNRIEGNNCTGADRGIDVDGAGNFIIKNTCSGNTTNWTIAAQNKCLVVLGSNTVAINGDSGGISPGSTDPNANYTY